MKGLGRKPAVQRSNVQGVEWPPLVAGQAAVLGALARQLDDSQWLDPDDLEARQRGQLAVLAAHCAQYSPFFQRTLKQSRLKPADLGRPGGLARLPVLTRRQLQSASDIFCSMAPNSHMPVAESRTSGSTGEPVIVRRTTVSGMVQWGFVLRGYFWHGRDFGDRVCAIRPQFERVERRPDWGSPANVLFNTGPALNIPISTDLETQLKLIDEFAPNALTIYPSNLIGLARLCAARGADVASLKLVSSIGETLSNETRDEVRAVLGVEMIDTYSSQELGCVAIQCAEGGGYHVMAEGLIVEVLNAEGEACQEEEAGRLVVTDLTNFATPLFRYDVGDWAVPGSACPCGRGLPTLKSILGRERNLVRFPDGTRRWPLVGFARYRDIAPVVQFQVVQDGRESLELRLVVERPLTEPEEDGIVAHLRETIGYPFNVRLTCFDGAIPPGRGGKFEEFMCLVD
ncbi:MAG TPA: AMP-binding protein [Caulobacteraceae bacterium]